MGRRARLRRAREGGGAEKAAPPFAPSGLPFIPPPSWPVGWWQGGYRSAPNEGAAAVEACVAAIAQTIAQLPFYHWRELENGGRELVTTSAASRVLRVPNPWQTRAEFFHTMLRNELYTGNAYAVATRNDRFEIDALYSVPARGTAPKVDAESGEVFYAIGDNPLMPGAASADRVFPARNVLHIRLYTPYHPLIGVTPLTHAETAIRTHASIADGVAAFTGNMARPSGVLTVPEKVVLAKETQEQLREDFGGYSSGQHQGRMGLLTHGIRWEPLKMDAFDEAIVAAQRLNIADIARVFRVPLAVIGDLGGATFNNVETLIQTWKAIGLGFILDHVELALDRVFRLPPNEYVEADFDVLLRADFQGRMEGLAKAVTSGIYSPNEARRREGLPKAAFGDEPRMQAQQVPLSQVAQTPPAPSAPAAPTTTPPGAADDAEDEDQDDTADDRAALVSRLKDLELAAVCTRFRLEAA